MPEHSRRIRWFVFGLIGTLALVVVILSVIGFRLSNDLERNTERLTRLETKNIAEDASRRTAEVASCFATARNRPALEVILRLIASTAKDPEDRRIVNGAITLYTDRAPTLKACNDLAERNNLNPKDFPPTVRGESGSRP